MQNVLVFGINGMLGFYVKLYFEDKNYNLIPVSRSDFNIDKLSRSNLKKFLKNQNFQKNEKNFVINCSGVIPQSITSHDCSYLKVNSLFPILLQYYSKKYHYKFIHITTDCVFDGKENGNYIESSEHLEDHIYGISKSLGEVSDATMIRTSLIGEEIINHRNFLEYFKKQKNGKAAGYPNHIWNGVTCYQLVKIIQKMIENETLIWKGVRHIFSPASKSKYELGEYINKIYELNITLEKKKHYKNINRTLSTSYNTCSLFEIPDIEKQIIEQKQFFQEKILINIGNGVLFSSPFLHLVIDDCLNYTFACKLQEEILAYESEKWDRYDNPFEKKFTFNKKNPFGPEVTKLFHFLESDSFICQLSTVFKKNLEKDSFKHYWGIHKYKNGDFLNIHLDAGIHPKMNKRKHVTFGLYLSKNWKEHNQGHLELWSGASIADNINETISYQLFHKEKSILPKFNRLILFECNDFSWHGNPRPVVCNSDEIRIFVTMSYMSDDPENKNQNRRALFTSLPKEIYSPTLENLIKVRSDNSRCSEAYKS